VERTEYLFNASSGPYAEGLSKVLVSPPSILRFREANGPSAENVRKFISKIFEETWTHVPQPNLVKIGRWEVAE